MRTCSRSLKADEHNEQHDNESKFAGFAASFRCIEHYCDGRGFANAPPTARRSRKSRRHYSQCCCYAKISVTKLRGNVSVLEGSGGNIAVLTGRDGKLLVDAVITASRLRITEALDSLSGDPVKHLINSHWHFDHTDGNEWLHSIGAEISAHENTRKHLSATTRVEDWNFT